MGLYTDRIVHGMQIQGLAHRPACKCDTVTLEIDFPRTSKFPIGTIYWYLVAKKTYLYKYHILARDELISIDNPISSLKLA